MRTLLISLATAASALALASPAAAQWHPPQPQGYAYGHYNSHGQIRRLQVRVDQVQRRIVQLDRRNQISRREANRLREQSRDLERRLHFAARNGLHPAEVHNLEHRLGRLEHRVYRGAGAPNLGRPGYHDGRPAYYDGRQGYHDDRWDDGDRRGRGDGRWRDRDDD